MVAALRVWSSRTTVVSTDRRVSVSVRHKRYVDKPSREPLVCPALPSFQLSASTSAWSIECTTRPSMQSISVFLGIEWRFVPAPTKAPRGAVRRYSRVSVASVSGRGGRGYRLLRPAPRRNSRRLGTMNTERIMPAPIPMTATASWLTPDMLRFRSGERSAKVWGKRGDCKSEFGAACADHSLSTAGHRTGLLARLAGQGRRAKRRSPWRWLRPAVSAGIGSRGPAWVPPRWRGSAPPGSSR